MWAKMTPMSLKPVLAQLYNTTLAESWTECRLKDYIVIGQHDLDCVGGVREARYHDIMNNRYDAVHMFGSTGKKAYTVSVLEILNGAGLSETPGKSSLDFYKEQMMVQYRGRSMPKRRGHNIRRQGYKESEDAFRGRYTVPTANRFNHLNC